MEISTTALHWLIQFLKTQLTCANIKLGDFYFEAAFSIDPDSSQVLKFVFYDQ